MNITILNRKVSFSNDAEACRFYETLYKNILDTKSIKGIEIEIPSMDIECSCADFVNTGNRFKKKGGIYFLFDKDERLRNIGNTSDLNDRVYKKWMGKNGGSKADYYFADYYHKVAVFIEEDYQKRKLYEIYLINKLKPSLNSKLNYYDKSIYNETLAIKEAEAKARRRLGFPSFGYERQSY